MNMFAGFNKNPAMTLQDIKETKRYGRTDARTDNDKTVYPLQTKFAGGIIKELKRKEITIYVRCCCLVTFSDSYRLRGL